MSTLNQILNSYKSEHPMTGVMTSVVVVLFHVMEADRWVNFKEINKLYEILNTQFNQDKEDIDKIIKSISSISGSVQEHAHAINQYLNEINYQPLQMMDVVNQLILVDGIDPREYPVFEQMQAIITG